MSFSRLQFTRIRTIGVGSSSYVELCKWEEKNQFVALKVISKEFILQTNQLDHIHSEKQILQSINNPGVVQFFGSFQDDFNIYFIEEFVPGGELYSHLRSVKKFNLDVVRFYAAEILVVLEALHRNGIVYRDLKPENLLLDQDGHLRFVDFGYAKKIVDRTYTLCGTPEYMAPEIVRGEGASIFSDWWSFGVLIYELLIGKTPFADSNENKLYLNICKGSVPYPARSLDPTTKDFINKLLQVDVTERLGCTALGTEEIKKHPWFSGIRWNKVYFRRYRPLLMPKIDTPSDSTNYSDFSDTNLYGNVICSDIPQSYIEGF